MSTFAVTIKKILAVEPHPNADAIEIALIDGYHSIVKKGEFNVGDLVAYIPEASVLPQWLLKRLGFWDEEKGRGKLNGTEGNRVKAIRLRGVLSQGLCYPVKRALGNDSLLENEPFDFIEVDKDAVGAPGFVVREGDDVASLLQIRKHTPVVPDDLAGDVYALDYENSIDYDVEDFKAHPNLLREGEEIIFTEKLHGVCTIIAILPYSCAHPQAFGQKKNIAISSKGLMAQGLVFMNYEKNQGNVYVRSTRALIERIDELQRDNEDGVDVPNFLLGETYGPGVQDLTYGKALGLRIFAAAYGFRGYQRFQNWASIEGSLKSTFGFETVPVLYRGPYCVSVMREYTDGKTTLDGAHIREGIVMVPAAERYDLSIGRVCLKSVSGDYLTRKGGTEYN